MSATYINRLTKTFCTLAVLSVFVGSAAFSQTTSVLTGVVRDASTHQPVADVVVTATSPNLQGEQVVVTDSSGLYLIPQLPLGLYSLRFEKESFHPLTRGGIQLRAGVTLRADVDLLPESLQETVEIVGRPPTIDVGSSSVGGTISSDFVRNIAVSRPGGLGGSARGFESVAATLPQATDDAFGVSINGSSSPENAYKIDGQSVNSVAKSFNASPLSIEFIDEVDVIEGGYMPEYGRTTGGTISAITKSGGNEFHGSVWNTITPGFLSAKGTRAANYTGSTMLSQSNLWNIGDFGASLGGFIIKDKLWFFAGIQPSYSRFQESGGTQTLGAKPTDPSQTPVIHQIDAYNRFADQRELQYIAKLTFLANQDNRIALTLTGTPRWSGSKTSYGFNGIENQGGPIVVENGQFGALNTLGNEGSTDVTLKWNSSFLSKKVLLDTTLGYHHEYVSDLPIDGSKIGGGGLAAQPLVQFAKSTPFRQLGEYTNLPQNVQAQCDANIVAGGRGCIQNSWYAGGPGFIDDRHGDAINLDIVATYIAQALGHHVFKAGFDLLGSRYDSNRAYTGGTAFKEGRKATTFTARRAYGYLTAPDILTTLTNIDNVTRQSTIGGFLQDSWSVMDVFTVNVGLRYDAQTLYDDNMNTLLAMPNQLSPRVGLVFDPTQSGKAKLFANYSLFYQNIALNIADRGLTGIHLAGEPGFFAVNSHLTCDPRSTTPGASCVGGPVAGGFPAANNPSQFYSAYNANRSILDPDIKAPSTNEFVLGGEYEIFQNARLSATYTRRRLLRAIEDMSIDNANTFFIGNPGFGIASSFVKPTRNYDAVTVSLAKSFADNWLAQVSYTWSKLVGNYDGLFAKQADTSIQFDPNSNATFDLASFLPNSYGPLNSDITHVVKLYGAKTFVFGAQGLNLGLGYTGHSGAPTSYIGYDSIYNQPLVYLVERGSGPRTPWVNDFDGHIGYDFRFTKDTTLGITADVFNLFNWQTTTDTDQRYTLNNNTATLPIQAGKVTDIANCRTAGGGSAGCKLQQTDGPFDPANYNPNFQKPLLFQAPREVRLGVRLSF